MAERDPPRLRDGRYYTRSELALAAGQALKDSGTSHAAAAERIGATHRTAITRAVNPDDPAGVDTCRRILETYGDYSFDEEPSYRVHRT